LVSLAQQRQPYMCRLGGCGSWSRLVKAVPSPSIESAFPPSRRIYSC
jgi:hypothetical protein